MKVTAPSLAPMLRSDVQGRLLARLLLDPDREYTISELAEWTRSSMPTVLREVGRAERAGILRTRKLGQARMASANIAHPLFRVVRQLVVATYGPPAIIAKEFEQVAGVSAVVIFGSWASRYLGEPG